MLTDEEKKLILDYADSSMNSREVGRRWYIDRTAILYRLKKIHKKTGLNPQVFLDLMELYRMAKGETEVCG